VSQSALTTDGISGYSIQFESRCVKSGRATCLLGLFTVQGYGGPTPGVMVQLLSS
jgi:hypothetical protein